MIKTDIILANGDDIKDFYNKFGLEINVIKNGVDLDIWKGDPPSMDGIVNVGYIGRLSKVKGIEAYLKLIESIQLSKYKNKFRFHTIGKTGDYSSIIDEYADNSWIINHGIIPNQELPSFLKTIDICVALTYSSNQGGGGGTSNAMLEQMAASRIILAWDNAIFRQYLNKNNSYLAPQYSIEELEKALMSIYDNNKEEAILKSKQACQTITPFTYEANVKAFIKLCNIELAQFAPFYPE